MTDILKRLSVRIWTCLNDIHVYESCTLVKQSFSIEIKSCTLVKQSFSIEIKSCTLVKQSFSIEIKFTATSHIRAI